MHTGRRLIQEITQLRKRSGRTYYSYRKTEYRNNAQWSVFDKIWS